MSCSRSSAARRGFLTLALVGILLSLISPQRASAQNLLTNGDFSNIGTITLNNGYAAVGNGNLIPGWTTTIGSANNANVYIATSNSGATWIPNPQSPPYSVQLDSTSNDPLGTSSTIAQTITVTAGQSYLLSFWFTTEVKPNLTSIIQVTLTGRGGFSSTNSYSTTAPANITQANAVWVHITQTFTPTRNGNFTITFADISTSDSNASLDNVSVTLIPEPATYAAGALAIGLIGVRERRRRRAKLVAT